MQYKPQKAKVVVVAREQVFGWGRVILWAIFHGAVTTIVAGAACQVRAPVSLTPVFRPIDPWVFAHAATIFAVLMVAPIPWLYPHTPGWRIVAFAAIYALGLVVWREVDFLLSVQMELRIPVLYRPGMVGISFSTRNLLSGGFVGPSLVWLICRGFRGPIVKQDGTLCPNCAYSLLGCAERHVCPECGREFTFQELGTTAKRLAALAKCDEATENETADDQRCGTAE